VVEAHAPIEEGDRVGVVAQPLDTHASQTGENRVDSPQHSNDWVPSSLISPFRNQVRYQKGRLTRAPFAFLNRYAGVLQLPGLDSNQQPSG
jgi:hypothetical protein